MKDLYLCIYMDPDNFVINYVHVRLEFSTARLQFFCNHYVRMYAFAVINICNCQIAVLFVRKLGSTYFSNIEF